MLLRRRGGGCRGVGCGKLALASAASPKVFSLLARRRDVSTNTCSLSRHWLQARLCRIRTKVCTAPFSGRCLQNKLWMGSWKKEGAPLPSLQSQNWRLSAGNRYLGRQQEPSVCLCHSAPAAAVPKKALEEKAEEFKLVYRFPWIKYCRVLSRLKLLQTATTTVTLPPICYLYLQDQVSQGILLYTTGIALFAGAMLYGMSYFFRRIIGLIYLNETGRTVKVAHLTFWGRRNDIYCPIETVMTLDEVGDSKGELLLQFKRYNSTDILYFTIKFGQIVDKQRFTQIFGELE